MINQNIDNKLSDIKTWTLQKIRGLYRFYMNYNGDNYYLETETPKEMADEVRGLVNKLLKNE